MAPGLYVHVPFCKTKCPYCDFFSVTTLSLIPRWMEAIKRDAALYHNRFASFDTVYVGGGTPSILDDAHVAQLLEHLFSHFPIAAHAEVTIEANPDDITKEKLELYKSLGVNRISLGAQSFHDQELQRLKRRHTASQTIQALNNIRTAGFTNIGIDLMYALEGQTEAVWVETLEQALLFQPEHLSCYQLTVACDTAFGALAAQGQIQLPEEEQERSFFLLTSSFLEEHGYHQYEISNYARSEQYVCRHNWKYWHHTPYLGLGPSAHSFDGEQRWWNASSLSRYCELISQGTGPVAETEKLSSEQRYLESLSLGFRTTQGISLSLVEHHPHAARILSDLEREHLITIQDGRAVPTREGLLVADSLPLLFITP